MTMTRKRDAATSSLTLKLLGFALGSFAFGFALVPFYDVLCDITGFGDQKALTEARLSIEQPDDTRTITVDFIADLPSVGNWEFRPTVASMQVHPGRLYKTEFFAHNLTGHDDHGAGRAQHRARQGRGLLPQDRVLLLHAAALRGQRAAAHGRALRGRSGAAALGRSHHAFVHFL